MHATAVAVPRLAATVLLLARSTDLGLDRANPVFEKSHMKPNDIHVLMVRRHSKARFMPEQYVFPGGVVDAEDGAVAVEMGFVPASEVNGKLGEAWRSRIAALRELSEEASCVLKGDNTIESLGDWQGSPAGKAAARCYDATAAPALTPIGRWVTPEDNAYRYDTFFYGAAARGGGRLPPQLVKLHSQESEISRLLWVSPLEALIRHEEPSEAFVLPPPTFHLLAALARVQSFEELARIWQRPREERAAWPDPEEASFPPVTPGSRRSGDTTDVAAFHVPVNCFHNLGTEGLLERGHYTVPTGHSTARVDVFVGDGAESMPAKPITYLK